MQRIMNFAGNLLVGLALVFSAAAVRGQDWPQWRGPQRDGGLLGGRRADTRSLRRAFPSYGGPRLSARRGRLHLRSVEGVEAAALFKDYDGAVRVSLRSSGRVNVQAAAATMGGGGHFMASGLTYPGDLGAALEGVHAALRAQGL